MRRRKMTASAAMPNTSSISFPCFSVSYTVAALSVRSPGETELRGHADAQAHRERGEDRHHAPARAGPQRNALGADDQRHANRDPFERQAPVA